MHPCRNSRQLQNFRGTQQNLICISAFSEGRGMQALGQDVVPRPPGILWYISYHSNKKINGWFWFSLTLIFRERQIFHFIAWENASFVSLSKNFRFKPFRLKKPKIVEPIFYGETTTPKWNQAFGKPSVWKTKRGNQAAIVWKCFLL